MVGFGVLPLDGFVMVKGAILLGRREVGTRRAKVRANGPSAAHLDLEHTPKASREKGRRQVRALVQGELRRNSSGGVAWGAWK